MKNGKKQTPLEKFLEKEFDDMVKFADWQKAEVLKSLIKKELKPKR